MTQGSLAKDLHHKLIEEEDARACKAIDEKACQEVPGNFLLTIIANFFSKLGDAVSNPKIVLPWIMQTIGAIWHRCGGRAPDYPYLHQPSFYDTAEFRTGLDHSHWYLFRRQRECRSLAYR
jgi:hypothetical protein